VSADSAAQKAGIRPGDKILKIDGKPIANFFQVQVALGPKYEGDKVDVVVLRDEAEKSYTGLMLTGTVTAFNPGFLGILPMRDDPDPGVEVRHVYVGSPAEDAGVKVGDRIMKASPVMPEGVKGPPVPVLRNRNQLMNAIGSFPANTEVLLEIKRKDGGTTDKITVKLKAIPELLPPVLPMPSTREKAGVATEDKKEDEKKDEKKDAKKEDKKDDEKKDDDKKEIETGLLKRKNEVQGREYWLYVPKTYKSNVSYGVLVWLHNIGKGGRDADDFVKIWGAFCEDHNFIILGPKSASNESGWVASELEGIVATLKDVSREFTVDRTRIVAHGEGNGGQMAAYLGFNSREYIRGVAMTGANLGTAPKDNLPGQRLSFFLTAGDKHPEFKQIQEVPKALGEKKFPVVWRAMKDTGKEYLDGAVFEELKIWLDSLDRI
jgi:predicted esterase